MSFCTACKQEKPADQFHKGPRRDGTQCRCKVCKNTQQNAARAADVEKRREYARQWAADNRESEIERNRRYREANRELVRERARKRMAELRAADPEAARKYAREYWKNNPERRRQMDSRKAAARRGARAGDVVTAAQWRAIQARYRGRCAYCLKPSKRMQMDHVVPLSRGGHHLASNIVPACGPCNGSKQARDAQAWLMQKHGRFF